MNELAVMQEKEISITNEQVDLIRATIAKDATNDELQLFFYDCKRRGVHPLDKLIHFTKRKNRYTPVTSIDFMRSRAAESGEYAGSDDAIFIGNTPPESATVTVYRLVQGIKCSFTATARWNEYYPKDTFTGMWDKMPHTMLAKCSEALALRKAFPQQLSGLYTVEEMDQSNTKTERVAQPAHPQRRSDTHQPKDDNPFAGKDSDGLTIKDVAVKTGKDAKGKPWTKYHITASNNVTYTTFSKTLNESAVEAMRSGSTVVMDAEESQYGQELKSLSVVECEPAKTAEGWTIDKIINIITSSDDIDILDVNWKSLLPHIGKLDAAGKAKCQTMHDETKKCISETVKA